MKTTITFRHMQSSSALKEYVSEKLRKIERFMEGPAEVHVILNVEKNVQTAEIVVSAKGVKAQGHVGSQDMYGSIDAAIEKAEKTLKRHHDKEMAKSKSDRVAEL